MKTSKWWCRWPWDQAHARPGLLMVLAIALSGVAATVHAVVPNPTLSGPIAASAPAGDASRNYPFLATILFPNGSGYVEEEFFVEGTAKRYSGTCTTAGCLDTTARTARTPTLVSSDNPYRMRMVVRRPSESSRFNGKVIVEWFNVTNNWELDVQWYRSAEYFMRRGYAYVGVGVQRAGINGTPNGLRAWNPARYGTVDVSTNGAITDDSLKWDIFSQVAQAIKSARRRRSAARTHRIAHADRDRGLAIVGQPGRVHQHRAPARAHLRRVSCSAGRSARRFARTPTPRC